MKLRNAIHKMTNALNETKPLFCGPEARMRSLAEHGQ